MEPTSLTSAGKIIMMIFYLLGMPEGKRPLQIDIISKKGIEIEELVVRPIAGGMAFFGSNDNDATKLMDIRRNGSTTSFTVSNDDTVKDDDELFDLKKIFSDFDLKEIFRESTAVLKTADGKSFKIKKSGATVYITDPSELTLSIHQ